MFSSTNISPPRIKLLLMTRLWTLIQALRKALNNQAAFAVIGAWTPVDGLDPASGQEHKSAFLYVSANVIIFRWLKSCHSTQTEGPSLFSIFPQGFMEELDNFRQEHFRGFCLLPR